MNIATVRLQCGRLLIGLFAATLFFASSAGVSSALAASPSSASQLVVPVADVTPQAVQDCCAGTWYPWGWYATKAKCTAAGKEIVRTVPVALSYKCSYVSNPPASAKGLHYHLYVFEAT